MCYLRLASLLSCILTLCLPATAHSAEKTKAIVGGTVINVESGVQIHNAVVLIEGERIKSVGSRSEVAVPDEATVIDATGKWLIPGMINMHVHLDLILPGKDADALRHETDAERALRAADRARKSVYAGTTTVRITGDEERVAYAVDKAVKRGEFYGPRMYSAGRPLIPTGGHSATPVEDGVDGKDEVMAAVRGEILHGATWIKLLITKGIADPTGAITGSDMTLEEMSTAVDIAHRHHVKVSAHSSSDQATLDAVNAGVDSIEHGYFLTKDVFQVMRNKGVWYVPTIVVSQKGALEFFKKIGSPDWYLERARSVGESHWKALQTAIDVGVNIAMGTDQFPFEPNEGTVASVRETELYVEAGMTNLQALRAATINAARLLDADSELGVIAPGKYADILFLEQDPLQDIRALRTLGIVIKGGEIIRNDWSD